MRSRTGNITAPPRCVPGWRYIGLSLLVCCGVITAAFAGDDDASGPALAQATPKRTTGAQTPKSGGDALSILQQALDRNTREIQALKDQHAKELESLRKQSETQQKQIEALTSQLKAQPGGAAPGGQNQNATNQELERLRRRVELQQKQMELLEQQAKLLADQAGNQAPTVEKLETETATLESRTQQAAQRDQELANAVDSLRETVDAQRRYPPPLPPTLKQLFLPTQTNVTPLSIYNSLFTNYHVFTKRKGAGNFEFEEFTPFFLVQLNKRFLLSAETTFTTGGVELGQAQLDMFITDWLTADLGYFLLPVGFWSERLDPGWINKLPDAPVVMNQVIPNGLASSGLQLRGARYLAGSPFKLEYSAFVTNGLGVPGDGKLQDFADNDALLGTTANVNSALAYGGRLGLWIPARGINFGASEFVNAPYGKAAGAVVNVWQPYFNYHYGNFDVRFEYGDMFEQTKNFIGNNIRRTGLYAQIAYRNYQSLNKYLQRLEGVFRFSEERFRGLDPSKLDLTAFDPQAAPVNRNQYTIGINYYFYPSTVLKFAYEINQELTHSLNDNEFIAQFATNF